MPRSKNNRDHTETGPVPAFYLTPGWIASATADPAYHSEPQTGATITEIEDDAAEEAFITGGDDSGEDPAAPTMNTPRGFAGLPGLRGHPGYGSEFLPQTPAVYGPPGPTSYIGQPRPAPPVAQQVIHLPVNFEVEKNKAAAAYYHNPYSAFKAEMAEAKETEMVQSRLDKMHRKQERALKRQEREERNKAKEERRHARKLQKEMAEMALQGERRKNKSKHRSRHDEVDPIIHDLSSSADSDATASHDEGRRRSRSRIRSRTKSKAKERGRRHSREARPHMTGRDAAQEKPLFPPTHAAWQALQSQPNTDQLEDRTRRHNREARPESPSEEALQEWMQSSQRPPLQQVPPQAQQYADQHAAAEELYNPRGRAYTASGIEHYPRGIQQVDHHYPTAAASYPPQRPYYGSSPPEALPYDAETYGRPGPSRPGIAPRRSSATHPSRSRYPGTPHPSFSRPDMRPDRRDAVSEPLPRAARSARPAAPSTPPAQTSRPSTPTGRMCGIALMKPKPRPHNPNIIEVIFPANTVYYLTLAQVNFDAPNAFTKVLDDLKPRLRAGKLVHVPVKHRNPLIYGIVVDYLNGLEILPLSSSHCIMLTGKAEPTFEAYMLLHDESNFYGLLRLSRKIDPILKAFIAEARSLAGLETEELPLEPFSLTSAEPMGGMISVKYIQNLFAQTPPGRSPVVGLPLMRGVAIDASINFAGRLRCYSDGTAPEPTLGYRISIPPSPLSQAFSDLLHWNRSDMGEGFSLDGELTRAEAARIIFDIEHIDSSAVFPERPISPQPKLRATRQSTLREICDGLNPILRNELYPWSEIVLGALHMVYARTGSPELQPMPFDYERELRRSEAVYVNLPVALVTFDFSFPRSRRDSKQYKFAIRQINAKTKELMREEGYEAASTIAGSP